jgi:hypothetical protein
VAGKACRAKTLLVASQSIDPQAAEVL